MYISELGRRAGASPKAVRLYESLGLLGKVGRKGTYRVYSEDNLRQVRLIRQAQALGFKLADMASVLPSGPGAPDWPTLLAHLDTRRALLRAEVARLEQLERKLGEISAEIAGCLALPITVTSDDCVLDMLDSVPRDKLHTF